MENTEVHQIKRVNLRIKIKGDWYLQDLANLCSSISKLYRFYYYTNRLIELYRDFVEKKVLFNEISHVSIAGFEIIDRLPYCFHDSFLKGDYEHGDSIQVVKLSYNSPGFADFAGLGKILEQLKEIIIYYFPNKKDKVEIEILEQERNALLIKNLQDIGVDDLTIQQLLLKEKEQLNNMKYLIGEQKIVSID